MMITDEVITCTTLVDRSRTPHEAIHATGRKECLNNVAVEHMPRGGNEKVSVVFFGLEEDEFDFDHGTKISELGIKKAYARRMLKPDPMAQIAVNEADEAFADENPNASWWPSESGGLCLIVFRRLGNQREVNVYHDFSFSGIGVRFFGGVRIE